MRNRRWGTPQCWASMVRQAMLQSSPVRSPDFAHLLLSGAGIEIPASLIRASSSRTARKSSPLFELNAPGTFSQTAYLGYFPFVASLISLIMRTASIKRPLRSPLKAGTFASDRKVLTWTAECDHINRWGAEAVHFCNVAKMFHECSLCIRTTPVRPQTGAWRNRAWRLTFPYRQRFHP